MGVRLQSGPDVVGPTFDACQVLSDVLQRISFPLQFGQELLAFQPSLLDSAGQCAEMIGAG